jgi:hypothetical protein
MENQWYCNRGQERFGPFSSAQLKQLAANGKLRPTDLIWKEGMPQPVPAGQANALFPKVVAEKKSASGETSSMPRRASETTPTMRATGGKDADSPRRPSPAENEQAEFSYRIPMRKLITAFPVITACGAFFVYLALYGNLQVVGIPLPEEIGKPILWAIALFSFLAPFHGLYFFIRDRSNPRKIVISSDWIAVPQTNIFNRARSIPYTSISEVKCFPFHRTKVLTIKHLGGKVELVATMLQNPADLDRVHGMLEQRLQRR